MAIDLDKLQKQAYSGMPDNPTSGFNLSFLQKEIRFRKNRLNHKRKERFYNQLWVLFASGVDLGSALQIMVEDEQNPKIKKIFGTIFNDVVKGISFSEAIEESGQFTNYEYYSIKVGEESGRLKEVLKELNSYFELRVQQRRQLSGALSYPVMVSFVAFAAVFFMLNVVVPMFAGVFKRFGGELPPITQGVLNLSNWFSHNFLFIILIGAALIPVLFTLRRYTWYKKYSSLLLLRVPFAGKLIRHMMHARFCHSVSLLTLSQVPLLDALSMIKEMITFYPMRLAVENIQSYIRKGKHMHEGMKDQPIFDKSLVSLTKIGEEVNQVGQLYARLYTQYTAEVKHMTAMLGNFLEPIMIIFVGLLVMVILIAMYLPLFQLSTSVL